MTSDRIPDHQRARIASQPTEATSGRFPADEPTRTGMPPENDLCRLLAHCIAQRAEGRIRSLQVDRVDGRIIVSGRTSTYYARQLAFAAAAELLGRPSETLDSEVYFDIRVI